MLAFPSNGHSLQFASPPIRILHHANEPAIAKRDTICVPPNSCSSSRRRTNSSPKFDLRSLPIPNCNSSCWRTSTCQRDIIRLSLQFAFPSNPSSHSSNSCKRPSACMRYNAFPPIPLRVHHAGAPAAAKRDTVRFMLAHHFQLESHFAIPIQVLCWRSNSLTRDTIHEPLQIQLIFIMLQLALHHLHKIQFAFSPNSNSNFPSCWRHVLSNSNCSSSRQPPLEKTIRAPLQFEIQFAFPSDSWCKRTSWIQLEIQYAFPSRSDFPSSILARQLELEIHFARISNCSSSCWRTSFSSRKQFAFPSIRTFLLGIHASVPTLTRDTIRISLRFPQIRISPKFAFPPNSHFPQICCAPASTRENNSRSPPNPLLIRHASASSIPRKQFMFPANSRFHTNLNSSSSCSSCPNSNS